MVSRPVNRGVFAVFAVVAVACDSDEPILEDAPVAIDALPDAPLCERTLLANGMTTDWTVQQQGPGDLTTGADYVQIQTTTTTGQTTGGQLLLTYPGAVTQGTPFRLEVVALVQTVSAHNPLDSAAAILGSFTPPFASTPERSQMIYLDANRMGWGDNTAAHAVAVTDGAYHTYVLAVDATGAAQVTIERDARARAHGLRHERHDRDWRPEQRAEPRRHDAHPLGAAALSVT
jgi:hypothetical protein